MCGGRALGGRQDERRAEGVCGVIGVRASINAENAGGMRKKTLEELDSLMARLSQEWAGRDQDCGRNKFTLNYCAGNLLGHQNDWESVLSMLRTRNSKIEIRERKDGYQAGGNSLPREACKGVSGGGGYMAPCEAPYENTDCL